MTLPNIFTKPVSEAVIQRIQALQSDSPACWGKMNVAQMLAHCNVPYEMVYDQKHPKPGLLMGFMLKAFVKKIVTNEHPYKQNSRTAPAFLITGSRDFELEKSRLIQYITRTQQSGEAAFDQKLSHSFGALSKNEWNNMFYKHLDHHLTQFGV